ncbi:hypothetical protein [uncultured Celeribacter sp.]|uniref:hypothetical protein n=1 Tax=uncultured Celeribacter sp. TaxID=1303376 RepID=UPI002AA81AE0|nr:hypothetical protein [uncultured Celeribacter sp.]
MPKANRDAARVAVEKFIKSQKLLDMDMTLNDLSRKIGSDVDPLAGYTFAWDKYVYDVADVAAEAAELPSSLRASVLERRGKVTGLLDMNTRISDLMDLTVESGIDEVAGYVYTEDKNTFVVASVTDEIKLER